MWETPIVITLIFFNIIFIVFLTAIVIFILEYRTKKKLHLKEIQKIDQVYKKELLKTQVEIQVNTMKHIGREIHDNVGQKLTIVSLYLKQIIDVKHNSKEHQTMLDISTIVDESLKELRQLSKSLTDDYIQTHSISELLEKECAKINQLKTCTVEFSRATEIKLNSYRVKSVLYRICQEFLQNSIKHANCKHIWVTINSINGVIQFVLKDDGLGFDKNKSHAKGIGLNNIYKRAALINGKVHLESKKNKGTQLTLELKL